METRPDKKIDLEQEVLIRNEETARKINLLIKGIIGEWGKSSEEISFPDYLIQWHGRIFFGDGQEKKSDTKRVIAGAVKKAILSGESVLVVQQNFEGQLFRVSKAIPPHSSEEKVVVAAFLRPNYFDSCVQQGSDPKKTIQDCLIELFYWDVKLSAEKCPRTHATPREETDCWIRITDRKKNSPPPVIYL
jgi:hypothetical protein